MFDLNQPLPSDYGSPGGTPSQLASLAGGEGALPNGYGAAKSDASASSGSKAEQTTKDLSDFAKGLTTALQESGVTGSFQSSGKASAPTVPSTAVADSDASKKWKVMAALAFGTALVGGTLWYGSKQGWFAPKEAP